MNIEERIDLLVKLGEYFVLNNEALQAVKEKAERQNAWFKQEFIELAIKNIIQNFLQRDLLQAWVDKYNISITQPQNVVF